MNAWGSFACVPCSPFERFDAEPRVTPGADPPSQPGTRLAVSERAGVPSGRLAITSAAFEEMPRHIRLFDAGLFFIRPSFSKRASAATKLAEFLGCGVPVIINDGVGDSGAIVRNKNVRVVLPAPLDAAAFASALPEVHAMLTNPKMGERCRWRGTSSARSSR